MYIVRCADGSLYTGVATDVERRVAQHNGELAGGARYTRGRRPVTLLWVEEADNRSEAQRREAEIKKRPVRQKLAIIGGKPSG